MGCISGMDRGTTFASGRLEKDQRRPSTRDGQGGFGRILSGSSRGHDARLAVVLGRIVDDIGDISVIALAGFQSGKIPTFSFGSMVQRWNQVDNLKTHGMSRR